MQVTIEQSGVIERKLNISVPSAELGDEIKKRLANVSKRAKIPGFRPGKAPKNIIERRYANQITNEVINDKIQSSYQQALTAEKMMPASLLSLEPAQYQAGQDLQYVATIELFPEIPCPNLSGKTIEKPVCEVRDGDIDKALEDLQKRNATYADKPAAAVAGDRVTIDFEGKIDGESFVGNSAKDFPFVLGEGQMLEQFDSALIGVKAAQTKQLKFTFPEDYHNKDVAAKKVRFSITVKKVEQAELPALNDAFAKQLGIAAGGIANLRQQIRTNLERELTTRIRSTVRERVMDALHQANKIQVPKALVEEEINRAVATITRQLQQQGIPSADIERNNYADQAKKRAALGLIARDVIEKNQIKVDAEAVRARVEELASGYDDAEGFINHYYSDQQHLQQIEAAILEQQVVNTMLDTAEVKEVAVEFREFMNL